MLKPVHHVAAAEAHSGISGAIAGPAPPEVEVGHVRAAQTTPQYSTQLTQRLREHNTRGRSSVVGLVGGPNSSHSNDIDRTSSSSSQRGSGGGLFRTLGAVDRPGARQTKQERVKARLQTAVEAGNYALVGQLIEELKQLDAELDPTVRRSQTVTVRREALSGAVGSGDGETRKRDSSIKSLRHIHKTLRNFEMAGNKKRNSLDSLGDRGSGALAIGDAVEDGGCVGRLWRGIACWKALHSLDEDVRQLDQHLEEGTTHNLITTGQQRKLLTVLKANPALIWRRDAAGNTPIHWAYTSGNLPLGRQLMEIFHKERALCCSGLDGKAYRGMNVLHIAVVKGSLEHCRWLVRKYPELLHGRATGSFFQPSGECYYGEYPLMFAVCTNQPDIVTMILDEVDRQRLSGPGMGLESVDAHGNTALHLTVWHDLLHMYEHVLFEVDRRRRRRQLKKAFEQVDLDGSGQLDQAEIENFCEKTLVS